MVFIPELKPLGSILEIDDSIPEYTARINEEVEMRDGGRIRMNVFIPKTGGPKFPVLMCSSPYGKDVDYRANSAYTKSGNDVPDYAAGKHLRFEAPSPFYWCPRGYVVVYWDKRGTSQSPGHFRIFCDEHFDDYAEMVTWAADQPWSTGKVGLTGISYLGVNQWPTAARQPRGLAAICPWEAMSDVYRESHRHGGISSNGLWNKWWWRQCTPIQYGSRNRAAGRWGPMSPEGELTEEQLEENRENPEIAFRDPKTEFIDDPIHKDRTANEDYSKIEVPVLSAGNWGGINMHLRGNMLGYLRAGSKYKFLRVHTGRHDLPYYYEPYVDQMVSFFDCFLKGDDHGGWKTGKEPPVKVTIRRGTAAMGTLDESKIFAWRSEQEWPIARTEYRKYYLTEDKTLSLQKPVAEGKLSYEGLTGNGFKFFGEIAKEEFELLGHGTVRLAISLSGHQGKIPAELDVFCALRKLDKNGEEVWYTSSTGEPTPVCFAWCRASHRTIAPQPYPELAEGALPFPVLSHKRSERKDVINDEIMDLQFELWPTSLVVEVGERLVFEVRPKDPEGVAWFGCFDPVDRNEGKLNGSNNIHFGGKHENYVELPIV